MNDRITNQESTHNMYNGTVICPNHLCGKEVSDKFDHCPFCHTLLIKPTKTAEDIINEYNRKEEDLRNDIKKRYKIDGNISEEQYGQLKEIYLKEYGKRNDAQENESSIVQGNGSIGWIIGISAALIIFIIIFFAAGGGHSKTYNNYMSSIRAQRSAINRATSLFDMVELDERILPLGALDYLTDGDEKRAVKMAHDGVWGLFESKCQQLAVGKYKLTSKSGHIYIIELTNEVNRQSDYWSYYLARIYKDNCLFGVGEWHQREITSDIVFEQSPNTYDDNIAICLKPNKSSRTLEWDGKLEKGNYGWTVNDEGTVEKIE